MLRKFVCAAIVSVMLGGVAMAETLFGIISKVDTEKKEITITPFKKKEKGEPQTIKYTGTTKVFKAKGKDDKEDVTIKDLKEAVEGGKGKGAFGKVEVTDGKATEITFFKFKKKEPKKDAE